MDTPSSKGKGSAKLSLLQDAAREVTKEDLLDTSKELVLIAHEIAIEKGLPSPLDKDRKQSPPPSRKHADRPVINNYNEPAIKQDDSAYHPLSSNPILEAIGDLQSLMTAIKEEDETLHTKPKVTIIDTQPIEDVNKDIDLIMPTKSAEVNLAKDWKEKYLSRRSKHLDRSTPTTLSMRQSSGSSLKAELSTQSMILRSSYANGQALKPSIQSLLTKEKEMLFLRMKKIKGKADAKDDPTAEAKESKDDRNEVSDAKSGPRKANESTSYDLQTIGSTMSMTGKMKSIEQYETEAKSHHKVVDRLNRRTNASQLQTFTSRYGDLKKTMSMSSKLSNSKNSDEKLSYYSSYDDAVNCTFHPKLHKYHNAESKSEQGGAVKFYDRQDAIEKSRRERLSDAIGMSDYDKLLTKKYCPNCGSKQSFDEYKEKRKKCSICNIEYKSKLAWTNKMANKFLTLQENFLENIELKKQQLLEEIETENRLMKVKRFDTTSGKLKEFLDCCPSYRKDNQWNKDVEQEFFQRLKDYFLKRNEKLTKLEEKIKQEKYPFKPIIGQGNESKNKTAEKSMFGFDDDDDDEDKPSFESFLKRYYEDLEVRHKDVVRVPYVSVMEKNHDSESRRESGTSRSYLAQRSGSFSSQSMSSSRSLSRRHRTYSP